MALRCSNLLWRYSENNCFIIVISVLYFSSSSVERLQPLSYHSVHLSCLYFHNEENSRENGDSFHSFVGKRDDRDRVHRVR